MNKMKPLSNFPWLESLLLVFFGTLTLLVGDRKGIWPIKMYTPKDFFLEHVKEKNGLIQIQQKMAVTMETDISVCRAHRHCSVAAVLSVFISKLD